MSGHFWSYEELVGHLGSSEPEVRFWAVDRTTHHYPVECCDAIAELLFDDHEAIPTLVARHLGRHGNANHHPILIRGVRLLRGMTPAHCLQALTELGYPGVVDLAAAALKRGDLTGPALASIVESLAGLGTPEARGQVREYLDRHAELLAEPASFRGLLGLAGTDELPELLEQYLATIGRGDTHHAGEAFRALMDSLCIDDAGWCFRTGPSGHIELRKTIKAVESGYDCDILSAMGEQSIKQIGQSFRTGNPKVVVRSIAEWTAGATDRVPRDESNDLPSRIAAAVRAWSSTNVLEEAERLGNPFQQWLLGFHLSAAFSVARGLNPELALRRARGDLGRLLELSSVETAHLVTELPAAIAVVCGDDAERSHRAQEWCLRMLEAQGPFFPKVTALETLGRLRAVHFIPEIIGYLSDENSYVYGAAERALKRMGEAMIGPAMASLEEGVLDPEAGHSVLVLLCDLGTEAAYEAVGRHFDWFMDAVGPGTTAEWVSLFGREELIDPLRDWLDEDPPLVGQALLLIGALHNVPIPEEEEIIRAIEDERAREADASGDGLSGGDGGGWVM